MNDQKIIVAGLIEKDGKYFIAKRSDKMSIPDKWEFPGGKVENNETDQEALQREIIEEFNTIINVGKLLVSTKIDEYTTLKLYACTHELGGYHPKEHSETAWVNNLQSIRAYDLAPADIDLMDQISKDHRTPSLHELIPGNAYSNDDITRIFLVSTQGGMRRSLRANSLILFSLHNTGNPYDDTWNDDGIMHYTGMGLTGNQSLDNAQNKTLAESRINGVDVHLFESYEPKEYIYRGRVRLADDPYFKTEKDESGKDRQVVKFPLKLL